jgi:mercuric ion transport protein
MRVELIYENTCPNIAAARAQLMHAFAAAGQTPRWTEWEVNDPRTPAHARVYGSPTILVDGRDVAGEPPTDSEACCRIYADSEESNRGVPSVAVITRALQAAAAEPGHRTRRVLGLNTAVLPTVGTALLPKLACPACWPAYTGLLGSLGLGFIDYTPYLLPLTGLFLASALAALAYRARTRRGFGPFWLGLIAGIGLVVGKFAYAGDAAMYVGIAGLVGASLWNTWPGKTRPGGTPSCPECVPSTGE